MAKNDVLCQKVDFLQKFTTPKVFEACGVYISSQKLIVICLYRTPKSDPNLFLNKLDLVLHEISKRYKRKTKIVITGDFNINTLKRGKFSDYLKDISNIYNLRIHIDVPTRRDTCIDNILSNITNATATVLPLFLSDHDTAQILSFPVEHKNCTPKAYFITKRNYCVENIKKF